MTLQISIDKEKTISSKSTFLALSDNSKTINKLPSYAGKRVNFLLCPSCFWCASCLSPQNWQQGEDPKCPSCVEDNIESIPIAENEEYTINHDTKRGFTMEFFR